MKQLRATYSITTPMFLGGADPESAGLRPPSFKGALRFWWRALMWGEMPGSDAAAKLRELHAREARLFGNAAGEDGSAQSRVLISIDGAQPRTLSVQNILKQLPRGSTGSGIRYFLGQGLDGRNAISPRSFSVDLTFRNGISEEERRQVERALFAFGLLGGLGSRARKGFGSCSLTAITGDRCLADPLSEPPTTLEEFRACLRRIVGRTAGVTPEISAFSDASRIDVSLTERSALTVLDQAGQTMSEIRKAMGGDTALAVGVMKGTKPSKVPDRATFGLPLQFYFSEEKTKVFFEVQPDEDQARRDRRASPLFLHVHQLRGEVQNKYALIQTFLPARFLPKNDQIRAKASPGRSFPLRHASPNWEPVTQYLDVYKDQAAGYLEVLP